MTTGPRSRPHRTSVNVSSLILRTNSSRTAIYVRLVPTRTSRRRLESRRGSSTATVWLMSLGVNRGMTTSEASPTAAIADRCARLEGHRGSRRSSGHRCHRRPSARRGTRWCPGGGVVQHQRPPDGRLLVCDADRGLLRIDPGSGSVEPLDTAIGGQPSKLCDNAAVAADGTICFTDSSRRYRLADYRADLIECTATGRLRRRDSDGDIEVELDHLDSPTAWLWQRTNPSSRLPKPAQRRFLRVWPIGPRYGSRRFRRRPARSARQDVDWNSRPNLGGDPYAPGCGRCV
jgi:hypothetical protein